MLGENAGKHRSESAAVSGRGGVGLVEKIAKGLPKKRLGAAHKFFRSLTEADTPDGDGVLGRFGQFERLEFALVEPGNVADLVHVVVFRGHPENRDGRNPLANEFVGRLNRRQSLVEGVGGATEEPDLLTRDNRDSTFGQQSQIVLRLGSAAERDILRAQNIGDFAAAIDREVQFMGQTSGTFQFGVVFVKGLDLGEILNIVAEELRRMRQLVRKKGTTVHERLDDRQRKK